MAQTNNPILLIEDDLSLRGSLCQFLEDQGYRTMTAGTVRHGWDLIRSKRPMLCLLDLNLPDGSGLDVLKRIVQHRLEIRVVVMTAFDLQHLRPADAGEMLVGWLTKPVNPQELLGLVEKVMRPQNAPCERA
jgi:two-component system OmpR family response regulator